MRYKYIFFLKKGVLFGVEDEVEIREVTFTEKEKRSGSYK